MVEINLIDKNMAEKNINIKVVGCGDAFSSGARAHSCFAIKDSHGIFTVDFGATSMLALEQQNINFEDIDLVILTHLHGDHFGGLPYLILAREYAAKQKRPLHIIGPIGTKMRLNQLLECCYPGHGDRDWSYGLTVSELELEKPQTHLNRTITAYKVNHFAGDAPCLALKIVTCGKVLGFSGDTGWVENLIKVASKTDIFFCECNDLTPQDYDGHMDYEILQENLHLLDTKKIVLNHAGPDMLQGLNPKMLQRINKADLTLAHDGMSIEL